MTGGERTRVRSASPLLLLPWLPRGVAQRTGPAGAGAPPAGSEPQRPAAGCSPALGVPSHSLVAAGGKRAVCTPSCCALRPHGHEARTGRWQFFRAASSCPPTPPSRPLTPTHTSLCIRLVSLGQQPGLPSSLASSPLGILWPRGLSQVTQSTFESSHL